MVVLLISLAIEQAGLLKSIILCRVRLARKFLTSIRKAIFALVRGIVSPLKAKRP